MTAYQRRRYAGGRRVDREPAASIDDLEAAQLARADREDAARAAAPAPAPAPAPKPKPKQEPGPRMGPSIRPHSATLVPESVLPRAASPEPAAAATPVPAAVPDPSPAPAAAPKIEPPVRVGPVTLTLPEGVEKVVFHMGGVAPSDPDAITDTADLRAFLIGTMKRANEGRLSPTIVESVCKLADRVMHATQLELEAARILKDGDRSIRAIQLTGDEA